MMFGSRIVELRAFAESQRRMKLAAGDDIADILCELIDAYEKMEEMRDIIHRKLLIADNDKNRLYSEVERLKEFERIYQELCK